MRGERLLFRNISLEVVPGSVCLVAGPNGSGKSSLLRILANLLRPAAGTVSGNDDLHHCGHLHALSAPLTLRANMAFWARLLDGSRIEEAAGALGLSHVLDVPTGALSAGQRQRAALARLHLAPRPLWLLDEPTAALDADGEALVAGHIEKHTARGGLAVVATHRMLNLSAPTSSLRLGEAE